MPTLSDIAPYLDALLGTADVPDYPNALNGVQVENEGEVVKVAAAVDARERTIDGAIAAGANLLLVHHGLFWSGLQRLSGPHRRRVLALLSENVAVYSSHLPLDAHPELGNNALLARELGLTPSSGFARHPKAATFHIGVAGEAEVPLATVVERADRFAREYGGAVRYSDADLDRVIRRWAICTGAGASADTLDEAKARRIDTLIVGEGPHWTAIDAQEAGLTIIYAGHYATETLGVRALAQHIADTFHLPWVFIDVPTGL
jgi:dinuclear metal center YbgI/SA1388 family protein